MTQEEKDLLLKDLSARLPYGVKINIRNDYTLTMENMEFNAYHLTTASYDFEYRGLRPYLRSMSSMIEKEENFYYSCLDEMDGYKQTFPVIYQDKALSLLDWLNEHHFDYRGLIEKGLALEAPDDMYKQ